MNKVLLLKVYFVLITLVISPYAFGDTVVEATKTLIAAIPKQKKKVKILSIDGGGIRGIIPALVLKNIESRLKKGRHITDCFDVMAGTSTGGIIVLLLNTPEADGRPKYTVSEVLDLYEKLGEDVFQPSLWQKVKTGGGWWGAKYGEAELESVLSQYMGDVQLKDTVKEVIVPAYEVELDKTFFFKTSRAIREVDRNYYIKDVARATSAAPTYFKPAQISGVSKKDTYVLVDGGVSVNNPSLAATVHASELYGNDAEFFIVSLGTGTNYGANKAKVKREDVEDAGLIGWAKKIIPVMMYAVNAVTDYEMAIVFDHDMKTKHYFRLQAILEPQYTDMDVVTPANIQALKDHAAQLILENEEALQQIADVLNEE